MRISGITIPDNKQLEFGLTEVYGVGRSRARMLLDELKIDPMTKAKDLSTDDEKKVREAVESLPIEGELRRGVSGHIKRLRDIQSYRGSRHARGLPARGQRTKTNSRTVRPYAGRKTMGSGRRKVEKK